MCVLWRAIVAPARYWEHIAGSYFGAVPLLFCARTGRRNVDTDESCARDRLGDETGGARFVNEAIDDREARGIALRHDHRLLDAIEVVRDQTQTGCFLRRFMQSHAIARVGV